MDKTISTNRPERLGFRLNAATKDLIEHAAQLEHRKVSDFCTAVLTEAAQRIIATHETLILSARDREVFFDTLMNPPPMNDRLRRALAANEQRVIETSIK